MDTVDKATRSRIMARIRSRNTGPERTLFAKLARAGLRFRKWPAAPGSPDALVEGRFAVHVHGCFWHGCPRHYRRPKSNGKFWGDKIRKNRARDRRALAEARRAGLEPVVVWECGLRGWKPRFRQEAPWVS